MRIDNEPKWNCVDDLLETGRSHCERMEKRKFDKDSSTFPLQNGHMRNEVSSGGDPVEDALRGKGVRGEGGSVVEGVTCSMRCPEPVARLRVEKIEGGLVVAGVVVAANCQIILPIFGFLFVLVGCVLTVASYRGPGADEDLSKYEARIALSGNARVLGPICIVVGTIMLAAATALCVLTRRARRRERRTVGFHCPLHGDFYPVGTGTLPKSFGGKEKMGMSCWSRRRGPGAVSVGPPQCPHSQVSSTRSSIASSSHHSQCPTPLPFLINPASVAGMVTTLGQGTSPDQFGSIRSLTVDREVASFPLSRTPTPPPFERSDDVVHLTEKEMLVDMHFEQIPVHRNASTKSVSIVLPLEEKG